MVIGKSVVLSDLMNAVWFSQLTLPLDQCGLKVRKLKMAPLFPSCCLLPPWDFLGFGKEVSMIGQTRKTQGHMLAGLPLKLFHWDSLLVVGSCNVHNRLRDA